MVIQRPDVPGGRAYSHGDLLGSNARLPSCKPSRLAVGGRQRMWCADPRLQNWPLGP